MRNYNVLITLSSLSLALLLTDCGGNNFQFQQGSTTDSFSQQSSIQKNPLDILFVVDNSSSMSDLQTNLTSNFASFITQFETEGYDFHIAVTTTDTYLNEAGYDNNPALAQFQDGTAATSFTGIFDVLPTTPNLNATFETNANQGADGSGDERAFSSMRDALSSPLNAGFLRSNSFLAVIVLSDEDDFSGAGRPEDSWLTAGGIPDHDYTAPTLDPISSYVTFLDTLTQSTGATRRWNLSTISILDSTCQASRVQISSAAIVAQRYMQLAQETNGTMGSICDASYASDLVNISNQIATLSTQFYLSKIPTVSTIVIVVNGSVVPQDPNNGWTYSSANNSIQFHGTSIPAPNASISITFLPDLNAMAGS